MIVLDTNVISEPLKLQPAPQVMAWLDNQSAETLYITAISRAELRFGVLKLAEGVRRAMYGATGGLVLVGIFAMRWNVVIGGQLFSKSFLGYTTYKVQFAAREGLLPAVALMILPFVIFFVLVKLLPPWQEGERHQPAEAAVTAD